MPTRRELIELFREMTELMTLAEGGPATFRVRAYENACEALKGTREELSEMSMSALTKIDGIGKSSAQKVREYFESGRITRLEDLREQFPADFVALGRIPGLGAKTLLRLRSELGVKNLSDLKAALEAQRIRAMKGMGAKSEEKLAKAIARIGSKQARRPIGSALSLAETLVEELSELKETKRVQFAGSLRRFRETIADIDLIVASADAAPIMEFFVSMGRVREVLARGETKASVVTNVGIQVDLRVVAPEQYGAALLYFTGSKAHNIRLRQRAQERGFTLNEYGLTRAESGELLASETEEDVYLALELDFVAPPLREDLGEVAAAAKGSLPELVSVDDILGDLHVHTSYSGDAKSSVAEVVEAAHARGYQYIAITDHGKDLRMNGVDEIGHAQIAREIETMRSQYPSMRIYHGCELNIGKQGELDYSQEERSKFDFCVASIHSYFELPPEQQTERLLRAMSDPSVRVLGHMMARSIGKREGIQCHVDEVLRGAIEANVAIEINSGLSRLDAPAEVLRRAGELGALFAINSDAHHADHLGGIRFGVRHSQRGWVSKDKVVNTWPLSTFEAWIGAGAGRAISRA